MAELEAKFCNKQLAQREHRWKKKNKNEGLFDSLGPQLVKNSKKKNKQKQTKNYLPAVINLFCFWYPVTGKLLIYTIFWWKFLYIDFSPSSTFM